MADTSVFDNERNGLIIPALGGFYERFAQPMAWSIFRVAIGGMLALEGWPKLMAPLAQVKFVENLGFYPGWLWSPALAAIQVFGGLLLVLGLFTRPAALASGIMLIITLWFHFSHPYGGAVLTQTGIDALKTSSDFFTANGLARLADGGVAFIHQAQEKAEQDSLFWTGGAFLFAAFGGGYLSLDRLLFKKRF